MSLTLISRTLDRVLVRSSSITESSIWLLEIWPKWILRTSTRRSGELHNVLQPRVTLQTHKTLVCRYLHPDSKKDWWLMLCFTVSFSFMVLWSLWHLTQFWKVKSYSLINWRKGLFLKSHTILYFWLCIQDRRKQFYYTNVFFLHLGWRHLLEKEEEAAADQLHLLTLLNVAVEQPEQLGDVGERQDQQRHLQLTGDHNTARIKTHTDTQHCRRWWL